MMEYQSTRSDALHATPAEAVLQGLAPDGGLYTMDGIPRYRWDGTKAVERTEEELEAERAAQPKPQPTTIEARVAALEADAEQAAMDRAALTLLLTGEESV